MSNVVLIYEEEPASGLPRLRVLEGRQVRAELLRGWEEQLTRRYESLQRGTPQTFLFASPVASLPIEYRVTVVPGRRTRMPSLRLESLEPSRERTPHTCAWPDLQRTERRQRSEPEDWRERFLRELAAFPRTLDLSPSRQDALRVVQEELRGLAETRPQELTLVLLVGYLKVAAQAAEVQNRTESHLKYTLISELLEDLYQGQIASGLLRRPGEAESPY